MLARLAARAITSPAAFLLAGVIDLGVLASVTAWGRLRPIRRAARRP